MYNWFSNVFKGYKKSYEFSFKSLVNSIPEPLYTNIQLILYDNFSIPYLFSHVLSDIKEQ
jgi:hypothetical protein